MATHIRVDTGTGCTVAVCTRCDWRTIQASTALVWLTAATHIRDIHDDAQGASEAIGFAKRSRIAQKRSYDFSHGNPHHDRAGTESLRN